jgi:hypothetical protein
MKTGGTYAITLASLATNNARQGAKADFGTLRAESWIARMTLNMDTAPANGVGVSLWLYTSDSATPGTNNTGGASGADAAYAGSAGGGVSGTMLQLQYIGTMPLTADGDTVVQIWESRPFTIPQRYGGPVVVNLSGVAFEGDDDSHRIDFYPLQDSVA